MFIERQNHPAIEFDPSKGQEEPALVHYFSDRAEPFKTVLPLLIEGAEKDEERVLVVTSPLSELLDEAIWLRRDPDSNAQVVVDEAHRPFFEAVKASLLQALASLDQIEFAHLDHDGEED